MAGSNVDNWYIRDTLRDVAIEYITYCGNDPAMVLYLSQEYDNTSVHRADAKSALAPFIDSEYEKHSKVSRISREEAIRCARKYFHFHTIFSTGTNYYVLDKLTADRILSECNASM